MNVNKLVPGMSHVPVECSDGAVCGVLIIQCKKSKKMYVGYRSNLYAAISTISSALRNGNHPNKLLQEAHDSDTLQYFTFPTDTVGEALDLRNSIIDEHAKEDIFLNIYGASHVERVIRQVARFPSPRSSKVIVNGDEYENRRAAALAFGFTVSTVAYRVKHPGYPNWIQA